MRLPLTRSRDSRSLGFILVLVALARCGIADDVRSTDSRVAKDGERTFLVIAPERFHKSLAAYIAHKQSQLPTSLVALETVLEQTAGADDPEKLKRYLYDAWKAEGARYALLVGDADVLPLRYMVLDRITPAAFDFAFYPSDLYYSDLARTDGEFDDWNAQREGFHAAYYGEVRGEKNKAEPINFDGIDYRPEVAVGRWPASTVEQAETIAAKTIAYEVALEDQTKPGARSAALLSVVGWVDSRPTLDRVAESLPADWSIERRYYADRGRDDRTPPPEQGELCRLLDAGLGFVFHAGHGTDTSWQDCFPLESAASLKNADRLPVMISAGCSTARLATLPPNEAYLDVDGHEHIGSDRGEVFDAPPPPPACYQPAPYNTTGLGEEIVRGGPGGAVAYIGCNTGSQPCGLTLLEGMAIELGQGGDRRLGDCWAGAVTHYYEAERLADLQPDDGWYPPSIFFQGMKFMLYGDPTLLLPTR